MTETESAGSSLAAHEAAQRLPIDIDPDETVDELWLPPTPSTRSPGTAALTLRIKDCYQMVRAQGEVSASSLVQDVFIGGYLHEKVGWSPGTFISDLIAPALPRLPGVEHNAGMYRFDASAAYQPAEPAEELTVEEAKSRLRQFDHRDDLHAGGTPNYAAARDAYLHLREQGTASREELIDHHNESIHQKPEKGHFRDSKVWYSAVGRPALEILPDVAAPITPAGDWKFLGGDTQ